MIRSAPSETGFFFITRYLDILEREKEIREDIKVAPQHLEFLKGVVVDLFVDMHKLITGAMPKSNEQCERALESYDFDSLLLAFKNTPGATAING